MFQKVQKEWFNDVEFIGPGLVCEECLKETNASLKTFVDPDSTDSACRFHAIALSKAYKQDDSFTYTCADVIHTIQPPWYFEVPNEITSRAQIEEVSQSVLLLMNM
eukprot:Lithocolla_globosa_v1_NODE_2376_length_2031_cov_3.865385.p4 type:complete len:106 gc:universal NODE_2376_length_2031_cov_3.865385:1143-826(-)